MEKQQTDKKIIKKEWHKQQELILKRWSEIGASYRFLHQKSFNKFEKQNMGFAIPVIVISTITGTANFAQGSFPENMKEYVPLIIGFFNLAAGLITTIAQFLRVSEMLEGHRAASIAYSKFSRNISVELSLPVKERTCGGTEFINNCRGELDRLIEQSPNIPDDIIKIFNKHFPTKDKEGNEINQFFKPEIFEIKSVEIYEDKDEADEKIQEALKKKQDFEMEMKQKILVEEKKRRKKIMKEFEKQKAKKDVEMKQKEIELKKIQEEEKMTTKYISSSLDGLLSGLQSSTSGLLSNNITKANNFTNMGKSIVNNLTTINNDTNDTNDTNDSDTSETDSSSSSENENENDNDNDNANISIVINDVGINNNTDNEEALDDLDNQILNGVNEIINNDVIDISSYKITDLSNNNQ